MKLPIDYNLIFHFFLPIDPHRGFYVKQSMSDGKRLLGWRELGQNISANWEKFRSNYLIVFYFLLFVVGLSYFDFWKCLLDSKASLTYDVLKTSNFTIPALLIGQIMLMAAKSVETKDQLTSSNIHFSVLLCFFCIITLILALTSQNLGIHISIFAFNLFMWIMSNSASKEFDLPPTNNPIVLNPEIEFEIQTPEDTGGLTL